VAWTKLIRRDGVKRGKPEEDLEESRGKREGGWKGEELRVKIPRSLISPIPIGLS